MNDNTKPMAHEEAEITHAIESYLLNELTEEQRTRFEEHYFECETCADAVIAGQTFVRGIRPIPEPVPWWQALWEKLKKPISLPLWGVCVCGGVLAAALFLGFHSAAVLVPLANTPLMAMQLVKGAESGPHYVVSTPSVTVEAVLPYDAKPFFFYLMKISKDQETRFSQVVNVPSADAKKISVQAPSKMLGLGNFEVTVTGLDDSAAKDGTLLGTYYFAVAKQ